MLDESDSDDEFGFSSFSPTAAAPAAKAKSKKRKLEEAIVSAHEKTAQQSLEKDFAERAPPAPAPAAEEAPEAPPPDAELAAASAATEVARIQEELARDFPGRHQRPKVPGVDKRSIMPGGKTDKKGKPITFNAKERRSRAKRGDNDYVQEEKRILRQTTDGYAMGY